MPQPKVILCDLGNVLIKFDHRIAVRRVLPYASKPFDEIYRIFFDSPVTKAYEEGEISSREFFDRLKNDLGFKRLPYKAFKTIWNEIFQENKGMAALLRTLKKNYRLHLVSNINKLHYDYVAKEFAEALSVFDKIILSCDVGARKPHPRIYRAAIEDEGFSRDEALYTDDRLDLIEKAREMGISGVVFKNVSDLRKTLQARKVMR